MTINQQRLIEKAVHHGVNRGYATSIMISTSRYSHISFAVGLALIQHETHFHNVFGHDPTTSIPRRWMGTFVTKFKYRYYKSRRGHHGDQGVGPGQLTYGPTQDYADNRGGCYKREVNIDVAIQTLAARIRDYGYAKGIERYNGSGPKAVLYSKQVRAEATAWRRILGT